MTIVKLYLANKVKELLGLDTCTPTHHKLIVFVSITI